MKKIIVASHNPVKLNAVKIALETCFPHLSVDIQGVSVSSGVSDQPLTHKETLAGAQSRTDNASILEPNAHMWIGIEGGVEDSDDGMESFAWVVVKGADGKYGKSKTASFYLPPQIVALVRQGKELGEADDIVFEKVNSKQEHGAVGILTCGHIDRTKYYAEALVLAFIPFLNEELYFGTQSQEGV